MDELSEAITIHLVSLATDDFGGKGFEGCVNGNVMNLRVTDEEGKAIMTVLGGDSSELAWELLLACMHNLSIEHLGALHLKPLRKPLQAAERRALPKEEHPDEGDVDDSQFAQLIAATMHGVVYHLLSVALDDQGQKDVQTCVSGNLTHLRIKDSKGEVAIQVCGEDMDEIGWQIVLACLHKISIDKLKELHGQQRKRMLQVQK